MELDRRAEERDWGRARASDEEGGPDADADADADDGRDRPAEENGMVRAAAYGDGAAARMLYGETGGREGNSGSAARADEADEDRWRVPGLAVAGRCSLSKLRWTLSW